MQKVDSEDQSEILVATFLIGEVLATIRDSEFQSLMEEAKKEARKRQDLPGAKAYITSRLQQLYSQNDPSVSLLYNLALLRVLTIVYGHAELAAIVDKLIRKHLRALVEKIAILSKE